MAGKAIDEMPCSFATRMLDLIQAHTHIHTHTLARRMLDLIRVSGFGFQGMRYAREAVAVC
jgi:hypothetical protein